MRNAFWSIGSLFVCLAARTASGDLAVSIRTVDGREESGLLTAIDGSSLVLDAGRSERRISLTDLIELHRDAGDDDAGTASRLFLATGDRLAVDVLRLQDDSLVCRWGEFEEVMEFQMPLEKVLGLVLHPAPDARAQRSLERQLQQREFQTDVLFLTNGDRLAGVFDALNQNRCRCETAAGLFDVNRSRVRAVGFNAALLAPGEQPESQLVLHMTDRSWLTCRSVEWQGGGVLRGLTPGGVPIPIPVRRVRSIFFYGRRVHSLADLDPRRTVMTPYLTRERPPRRNRNACDGPLVVRGQSFAKGLGMYSRTVVTYPLDGAYAKFQAVAGIDDLAGGDGSVVFTVDVDGERVFDSGVVTGRDEPLQVGPIDLHGAESITLTVDYGTRGDIGDVADWCNPVLIR